MPRAPKDTDTSSLAGLSDIPQAGQGCLLSSGLWRGWVPTETSLLGAKVTQQLPGSWLLLDLAGCHRQDNGCNRVIRLSLRRAIRLSPSRAASCGGVTLPSSSSPAPAEGRDPGAAFQTQSLSCPSALQPLANDTQGLWLLLQEKNMCEAFGSGTGCSSS